MGTEEKQQQTSLSWLFGLVTVAAVAFLLFRFGMNEGGPAYFVFGMLALAIAGGMIGFLFFGRIGIYSGIWFGFGIGLLAAALILGNF